MNKPPPQEALLAAAKRLTKSPEKSRSIQSPNSGSNSGWQDEAWDMYDLVGELRFIAGNLAGQSAKATIFIGKHAPGEDAPERIDDESVQEIMGPLSNSFGSLNQIVHRLILNLFVAGEGWLVGVPREDDTLLGELPEEGPEAYTWHMLSVSEVSRGKMNGEVSLTIEGEEQRFDEDDLYLIRVWRPHPRKWWEADSPTRSSLSVLRELVGLTMHVYAQVESRLAGAGLLIVPESAQRALQVASGISPDDVDSTRDGFTEALIEAMITPVSDRSSASALVPLTVTVPDEAVDAFKHMTFASPMDGETRELRDESIRRLALGLDAPPELLLGTGAMNHWGGWLVQAETVNSHIVPALGLICDALTTQYLQPFLEQAGYEDADEYVVWYNVDHLIARPNLSSDAHDLHDKGVLSDEALISATGFDVTDMPEKPADLVTTTVLGMIRSDPSLVVTPGIPYLRREVNALLGNKENDEVPNEDDDGDSSGDGKNLIPETEDDDAELPDE